MPSLSSNLSPMNNRRRSQRVLLRIPVEVTARGPENQPIGEQTHTVVVSAHGGLICLALKVRVGQVLILKNPETDEEQSCRVVSFNAPSEGKSEVAVEFVKPAPHFWRVSFPPSDWSPRDPEITADTF